jgi:hypothetical protein
MKAKAGIIAAFSIIAGMLAWAQQGSFRRPVTVENEEPVTFNKQIVRILQDRCQSCHHPGDIAPFSLITYQDAYNRRNQIRSITTDRIMPPWHVNSECGGFQDDPSLTGEQLHAIRQWVDSEAPEGNPGDLPPPLKFASGWSLGQPDMTFKMEEPMTPNFSKGDVYRCFVFPTNLGENRYVSAVEILPGSRAMVHHVLLFIDTTMESVRLDNADPGPGYTCFGGPGFTFLYALGGWAPGNKTKFLPDGIGLFLPKNSRIVMQVHYSARSGVVEADRTEIGLYFAQKPVQKTLLTLPLINLNFKIPAGAKNHPVTASFKFLPYDVHLHAITPHMHLLGRTMSVTATTLDGKKVCLADVPDWDFHWQSTYFYQEPIALKAGTRFDLIAHYDNSATNPNNPNNPPKDVGWGENTSDEMCIAFLSFTLDSENSSGSPGLAKTNLDSFSPFWKVDLSPRERAGHRNH